MSGEEIGCDKNFPFFHKKRQRPLLEKLLKMLITF